MSATPSTVRATVKRDFADAGTDRKFAEGEKHELSRGEYENYRAAGLVEPITDTASAPAKPKRGRTPRAAKGEATS